MKTSLAIDDDLLERARVLAARLGTLLVSVINEALRAGLDRIGQPAVRRPYHTKPGPMGPKAGLSLDSIQELSAQLESKGAR